MADFSSYTHKFRAVGDAYHQNGANKVSKRNRQPVSCFPCRSRKMKCDRGHPCETCIKRGEEDACSYSGSTNASRPSLSKQDGVGKRTKAQDRLQHLEALVMQMMKTSHQLDSAAGTTTVTIASESSPETTSSSTSISNEGHMRVQGNEARYVGSTHWSVILDNIQELKTAIVSETLPMDHEGNDREAGEPDSLFGAAQPPPLDQILQETLPARVQCDRRLSQYFKAKYLVSPFLHTYQFQRQYEQFWVDPLQTSPLWLSILFSVLCLSATLGEAVGLESETPEGAPTSRDRFLVAAVQCLLLGGYTKPKKHIVEALLLYSQCQYMATLDASRTVEITFTIITRLAYRMGYHRDPDNFSQFSKFEGEMRRRTWATCRQFDLMISFQLGLPNSIRSDSYDTQSPRNLLDADFDENTAELPPSRPEMEATRILYFVVKYRLMATFGKVCEFTLSFAPHDNNEVMTLDAEIRAAHATIPETLRIRPMSQSFADPGYLIMVRLNCEFLFRKSICVLHRKYMAHGSEYSSRACVDSAVAILGHLTDLHKEFQPFGQLHSERWMLSSFTMNDFLLAAMILCLALSLDQKKKQNGQSPSIDPGTSRTHLGLLKQVRVICQELGTTSKEAKRVADALEIMLRKLEPTLDTDLKEPSNYRPQDLVLTPLSLHDTDQQQQQQKQPPPPPPSPQQHQPQIQTQLQLQHQQQPHSTTSATMQPAIPHGFSSFGVFDNFLTGQENLDWTAFDQYLLDANTFQDMDQGWQSTPYRFLGQLDRGQTMIDGEPGGTAM